MKESQESQREYQREANKKHRKSKKGVVGTIYSGQKSSSLKGGHRPPDYTQKELVEWLYSQEIFHKIYSEWANSGYMKKLKPSVDRKNDDIHYCMNNIQLMTWGENIAKGHNQRKEGISTQGSLCKKVAQYTLDGEYIATYFSQNEASRQTGVSQSIISNSCKGKTKKTQKYTWEFIK